MAYTLDFHLILTDVVCKSNFGFVMIISTVDNNKHYLLLLKFFLIYILI